MKNFWRKFKTFINNVNRLWQSLPFTHKWKDSRNHCMNFIYFKNKITPIIKLKMIKYYLRFAIHSYSKLHVLNSVLYAPADQNMLTVIVRMISNEISNIEINLNLRDEKIGDNVPTMHQYLWTLKQANTF